MPHLRACMSFASSLIWFQVAMSVVATRVPTLTSVVYPMMCIFEAFNTFVAMRESRVPEARVAGGVEALLPGWPQGAPTFAAALAVFGAALLGELGSRDPAPAPLATRADPIVSEITAPP